MRGKVSDLTTQFRDAFQEEGATQKKSQTGGQMGHHTWGIFIAILSMLRTRQSSHFCILSTVELLTPGLKRAPNAEPCISQLLLKLTRT